jgi:hypothetical protein
VHRANGAQGYFIGEQMPKRAGTLTGNLFKLKFDDVYINKRVRQQVENIHNLALLAFYNELAQLPNFTGQTAASLRQIRDYLEAALPAYSSEIAPLKDFPDDERIAKTGARRRRKWFIEEKLANLSQAGVQSINADTGGGTDTTEFRVGGNLQPGVPLRKQPFKFHFYFKSGSHAFNLFQEIANGAKAAYKNKLDEELVFFTHKEKIINYISRVRVDLEALDDSLVPQEGG